ncbi:hypothetical protein BDR06DRAFT_1015290 [Suillus hirtellus]|nr:hypothetical protein BDR06DRAFT_1015290 [Suillus hirtellus]
MSQPRTAIESNGLEPKDLPKDPLFYDGDSDTETPIQSPRRELECYTLSGSRGPSPGGPGFLLNIDPEIHRVDIERFVKSEFEEQINNLAIASGFQVDLIQGVYKQVTCFKRLKKVIKAMQTSALDRAQAEIEAQELKDMLSRTRSA